MPKYQKSYSEMQQRRIAISHDASKEEDMRNKQWQNKTLQFQ